MSTYGILCISGFDFFAKIAHLLIFQCCLYKLSLEFFLWLN